MNFFSLDFFSIKQFPVQLIPGPLKKKDKNIEEELKDDHLSDEEGFQPCAVVNKKTTEKQEIKVVWSKS